MRIALCGIQKEVNTFAVESTGLGTITGNMSTEFQFFKGQKLIDEFKGAGIREVPRVYIADVLSRWRSVKPHRKLA